MKRKSLAFITLILCLFFLACGSHITWPPATQAGQNLTFPYFQAFDSNGAPLTGGLVYSYTAGGSTPRATYPTAADASAGTNANANPVVLDSDGKAAIYLSGTYKIILKTAAGVTLWTKDVVQGQGASILSFRLLSDYASLAAAVTAIGATETTLWIDTDDTLSATVTIPSTLATKITNGSVISDGGGTANLIINGSFEAGPVKCFDFTGGGAVTGLSFARPEWWGPNITPGTTSMSAEIRAAVASLTAGDVKFQAETYGCGKITMRSNVNLVGSGWGTVLDTGAARAILIADGANTDSQILISGVDNVQIKNMKLDGQSAGGSLGLAYSAGIHVDTSTNILIEDVWIYDQYYFGLHIKTGSSEVFVKNLLIEDGNQSSAILVGDFTGETGNVRNINFNNITVLNQFANGIGVWSNGTGTTENINFNNVVVRNYSTGVQGYGIYGTTDAKDVNISNFVIDTEAGGFGGHGIHLEAVQSWNFNNGLIVNLDNGYGINATGDVKDSNFSNITIKECLVRGLLVGATSNDNNFSNIIIDGSYSSAIVGGVRNTITNCKFIDEDFGTTGNAVSIQYNAEDFIFSNNQIHATGAGTTGSGILFNSANMVSATVKNNRITGTITTPVSGNTTKVTGETVSVRLREAVLAGTTYELPVLRLPATQNAYIHSIWLTFGADVVQNDTNYNTYRFYRRDSTGGAAANMTSAVTTMITGGADFDAHEPVEFAIGPHASANVPGGYGISIYKAVAGAGQAEADGLVTINYVTY